MAALVLFSVGDPVVLEIPVQGTRNEGLTVVTVIHGAEGNVSERRRERFAKRRGSFLRGKVAEGPIGTFLGQDPRDQEYRVQWDGMRERFSHVPARVLTSTRPKA